MVDAFRELFEHVDSDDDDGPELHVVGLRGDDLRTWFALLRELGGDFGESTIWDPEPDEDFLVAEHPDPAGAVIERQANTTPRVAGVIVGGVTLPDFAFFAYADEVQLFWWPSVHAWTGAEVDALVALLRRFLERVPHAALEPDPRYHEEYRAAAAAQLAALLATDEPASP